MNSFSIKSLPYELYEVIGLIKISFYAKRIGTPCFGGNIPPRAFILTGIMLSELSHKLLIEPNNLLKKLTKNKYKIKVKATRKESS